MEAYRRRTGERLTYLKIAERTGLSTATVESIGGILGYTTTTDTIEKLCITLGVTPGDLLELIDEPPEPEPSPKKTKKKTKKKKKATKKKKKTPKKKK